MSALELELQHPPALDPQTALLVRPLSIVPDGDEFLVGDVERTEYVMLPRIGVEVIQLLQAGHTVAETTATVGLDVDVPDFINTLLELGFVSVRRHGSVAAATRPVPVGLPLGLRHLFGRTGWTVAGVCVAVSLAIIARWPALLPTYQDIFFLGAPLPSIVCITLLTYGLAAVHEVCHWAAARAAGVDARMTINRRLYFLVFETDLSGLWSLPRARRYGPLLAGMAFDVVVFCVAEVGRAGVELGWWQLGAGIGPLLGAVAFVQLIALAAQGYVFMRTDLYAVLITATGCINLWRINQLRLLALVRRLNPAQQAELTAAHGRDLEVARWYAPISVVGVGLAVACFGVYFLPATLHLVEWLAATLVAAQLASGEFWAALAFSIVVLSPRALTLGVLGRDVYRRLFAPQIADR
jgi:putative peptide zinc metalloprotease protein